MARFPKPAEGSWTQHYPELGTGPVSYHDSISPEIYELERNAIFKRAWLNVGRVEQLPRKGSYFTKEMKAANTSIISRRASSSTSTRMRWVWSRWPVRCGKASSSSISRPSPNSRCGTSSDR